ncbi:flavin reductase [Aureimonas fodinaquatilis]|uniref:Flavin reductase n=2 Tax=Aureimonas fodinaquatilis TaxID=2565783 RepID=A0A5B0DXP7_9HYPH|nr:flavin reductase [Aureimonas fodinaquatilis]
MSHFAAAVHIVTTDGRAGIRGTTVTSVCSVSDMPATLLVCLNASSAVNDRYEKNGCFAVNILAAEHESLAKAFAGEGKLSLDERFALANWAPLVTGAPILENALASFDCRLTDARIVATHRVLIGEVVGLNVAPSAPGLVYKERHFHTL